MSDLSRSVSVSPLSGKLPWFTKFAYGFGEMAEGVKSGGLETFLFFYYVQVLGLSGSLTGLALLLSLIVDGITDPLIGNISDNFRSRFGRRHPFLYAAPIPLALFLYLLFAPPAGAEHYTLAVWLFLFASLARIMQSLYFVPHAALSAELSTDFSERISINSYRAAFAFVGRLVILGVAFSLFFAASEAWPDGQLNPAAYPPFALACGLIAIVVILVSAMGTHKRAITLYKDSMGKGALDGPVANIFVTLGLALRQRSFLVYFIVLLISFILGGIQAALSVHVMTFYWAVPSGGMQIVLMAAVAGFMVGLPAARPLAWRFDKKPVYIVCSILSVSIQALPLVLALLGLLTMSSDVVLVWMLTGATFLAGLVGGPAVAISGAMLADIADDFELKHHRRAEGALFGAMAFARKASLGLGGAVAGVALDLIGLNASALPDQVSAATKADLAILVGPAMFMVILASQALMLLYPLSHAKHDEILRKIKVMRSSGVPAEAPAIPAV